MTIISPKIPKPEDKCSKYFSYKDFFECSETYKKVLVNNIPKQIETYKAIEEISCKILDRIQDNFGEIEFTYGFCSISLQKKIKKNIYPKTDQHAGFETDKKGNVICNRGGIAVDFKITNLSSLELSRWIVQHCNFDRIYYYGKERPIHISLNRNPISQIILMQFKKVRVVPRVIKKNDFLEQIISF